MCYFRPRIIPIDTSLTINRSWMFTIQVFTRGYRFVTKVKCRPSVFESTPFIPFHADDDTFCTVSQFYFGFLQWFPKQNTIIEGLPDLTATQFNATLLPDIKHFIKISWLISIILVFTTNMFRMVGSVTLFTSSRFLYYRPYDVP